MFVAITRSRMLGWLCKLSKLLLTQLLTTNILNATIILLIKQNFLRSLFKVYFQSMSRPLQIRMQINMNLVFDNSEDGFSYL